MEEVSKETSNNIVIMNIDDSTLWKTQAEPATFQVTKSAKWNYDSMLWLMSKCMVINFRMKNAEIQELKIQEMPKQRSFKLLGLLLGKNMRVPAGILKKLEKDFTEPQTLILELFTKL